MGKMRTKAGYTFRKWEIVDFNKFLRESDFDYYLHLKARFFPRLYSKHGILLPHVDGIFVKKVNNKFHIALIEHKSNTRGGNTFKLEQSLLSNIMYYSRELKQTLFIKPTPEDNVYTLIYQLKEDKDYRKQLKIHPRKSILPAHITKSLSVPELFKRNTQLTIIEIPKTVFNKIHEVYKETENTKETQKRDHEYAQYWEQWNPALREIYKNKRKINIVEKIINELREKILKSLRGKVVQ